MKPRKKLLLWLIFIVVLIATIRFAASSWRKYQTWDAHQAYFEQAPENRKIETWMTPKFIKRYYKLKKIDALNEKIGFWEKRKPLSDLCEKKQLDCDVLVKAMNEQIGR